MQPSFAEAELTAEEPHTALYIAWRESAIDQTDPENDLQVQRDRLRQITEDAVSASDTEGVRDCIRNFGEVTSYLWFGDEQTPFPVALMKAQFDDQPDPAVTLNPHILDTRQFIQVRDRLSPLGLDNLLAHRQDMLTQQADNRLEFIARSIVADTPAYRLLESFIGRTELQERPLTTAERMLEEQAIEHRTRTRHGIDAHTPLRHNHAAWREATRDTQQLDEVTRFDHVTTPQDTPIFRAKQMFWELARAEFETPASKKHFGTIQAIETVNRASFGQTIQLTCEREDVLWDPASFFTLATALQHMATPNSLVGRSISEPLLADMALRLFTKDNSTPYEQTLEELLAKYTATLVTDLTKFATLDHRPQSFRYCATTLLVPQEATHDVGAGIVLIPCRDRTELSPSQNVISRREYAQAAKERVGVVRKRPAYDDGVRLLHFTSANQELPTLPHDDLDLVIKLDEWNDRLDVTTHGYELVSRDAETQTLGYRYSAEADPYVTCDVLVPAEAQRQLAQSYMDIGLVDLAARIGAQEPLTVTGLTAAISQTNRYTLPRRGSVHPVPEDLAGYAELVDDGRLAMQCTHAARFLSLSLQQAFSKGSAHSLDGLVMGSSTNRLSRLGHAQTVFIDPASQTLYILDATPSQGDSIQIWRDMLAGRRGRTNSKLSQIGLRRTVLAPTVDASAPQAPAGSDLGIRAINQSIAERESQRQQQFSAATHNFVLQLRMLFGKDGQPLAEAALREQIAALPSHDVLFRTVSALVRADFTELAAVHTFTQSLQACTDPMVLRQVDPRGYSRQPLLLPTIERNIHALMRLAPAVRS